MSFLSAFTTPAWQKLRRRAEEAARAGRHAEARLLLTDSLAKAPADEAPALRQALREAGQALVDQLEERCRGRIRARIWDEVDDLLETLAAVVQDTGDPAPLDALRAEAAEARRGEATRQRRAEPVEVLEDDPNDAMVDLVRPQWPEDVLDWYAERPVAWRRAVVATARGTVTDAHRETLRKAAAAPGATAHETLEAFAVAWNDGDADEARRLCMQALQRPLRWQGTFTTLADFSFWLRDEALGEQILQQAIDEDHQTLPVLHAAALHAAFYRHPDAGLEALDAADEQMQSPDPGLMRLRLRLLDIARRDDEADALVDAMWPRWWTLQPATRAMGTDADTAGVLTLFALRSGRQLARARQAMLAAVNQSPADVSWRLRLDLVLLLRRLGEDALAADQLEKAREEASQMPPQASALARLRMAQLTGDSQAFLALHAVLTPAQRQEWLQACEDRGEGAA